MADKKPLKVRVDLTVLIDVDDYRAAYGPDDLATIRDDVKRAVRDHVFSGGCSTRASWT